MSARTSFPASAASMDDQILDENDLAELPGGWLGKGTRDSDVTGITTEADITDLTVDVTPNPSRLLKVTVFIPRISSTVANDIASVFVYEDASQIGEARIDLGATVGGSNGGQHCSMTVLRTPSAAHTYKVRGSRANGSGTLTFRASGSALASILVEDIGPA